MNPNAGEDQVGDETSTRQQLAEASGENTRQVLTNQSTFVGTNTAEGQQTFAPDVKDQIALRKQDLTAEQKRHDLEEAAKDNASRRQRDAVLFYAVLGVVIGALCISVGVGVWSSNAGTRQWAQGAFTLILGTTLGALAGFFTGKSAK